MKVETANWKTGFFIRPRKCYNKISTCCCCCQKRANNVDGILIDSQEGLGLIKKARATHKLFLLLLQDCAMPMILNCKEMCARCTARSSFCCHLQPMRVNSTHQRGQGQGFVLLPMSRPNRPILNNQREIKFLHLENHRLMFSINSKYCNATDIY